MGLFIVLGLLGFVVIWLCCGGRRTPASARPGWTYEVMQWPAMLQQWPILRELQMFEECKDQVDGFTKITLEYVPEDFFQLHVPQSPSIRNAPFKYTYCVVRESDGAMIMNGSWPHRHVPLGQLQAYLMDQLNRQGGQLPRSWCILRISMSLWGYFFVDILSNQDGVIENWLQRRMAV